jgi:glutaredoxin-related protein
MKKIYIIFLILFFTQSCGYTPMYSKNQKVNFYIKSIEFTDSDKNLANYLKLNLNNYFEKKNGSEYIIDANISYKKTIASKDSTGEIEEYNLSSVAKFIIKSNNFSKAININETFKMENFTDEFQEKEYEENIKKNMTRSITSKLLFQLSRFDVN